MKTLKFLAVAVAACALAACNNSTTTTEVEKVTLDQTMVNLKVEETVQLTATVEPEGSATVTWESQDPTIATVADGLVTAVAEGQTMIVAKAGSKTASCLVVVGKIYDASTEFSYLLEGSNYYLFNGFGGDAYEKIKDKIVDDFRTNGDYDDEGNIVPADATSVLQIWNGDVTAANFPTTSGNNCFNETEGWMAWNAGTLGWGNMCGGIIQLNRKVDLTKVTGDQVFVIVFKTPATNAETAKVDFVISSTNAKGSVKKTVSATTNGKWTALEYKMSDLFAAGLDWTEVYEEGKFVNLEGENAGQPYAFFTLQIIVYPQGQGVEVDAVAVYTPKAE